MSALPTERPSSVWDSLCVSLLLYAALTALSDIAGAIREHTAVVLAAVDAVDTAAATPTRPAAEE